MRAVIVTTLALITLLLAGAPMFMHPPTGYFGITFRDNGALVQPNVIDVAPHSPAHEAGLRSGDSVSCISLRDGAILNGGGYTPGTPVNLCVTHDGVRRYVRLVPQTRPPATSIYGSDALAAVRLTGYALFLLCAAILVLGRPSLMTWLFFGYAIFASPNSASSFNLTFLDPTLYAFIAVLFAVMTLGQTALLLGFTILVPDDAPPTIARKRALAIAWVLLPVLAVIGILTWAQTAFTVTFHVAEWTSWSSTAIVIIALTCRLSTMKGAERARFAWAAFAIVWTVIIDVFRLVGVLPAPTSSMVSLFAVVTPLVLLYAVFNRHVIDIRFVVSRTLVYAVITTLVIAIVGAVDWATSAYLHEVKIAMALDALATIAVAFALNRLHRWIERAVDIALFREKYAAEEYLDRLGRTLLDAQREETIHSELVRAPVRALNLTMAAVFREAESAFTVCASAGRDVNLPPAFDRDHEVVRFLNADRALVRLRDIAFESRAEIAIPIFQGKRLTGFVLYGAHSDGTQLDPDEVETLKRFCDSAAQAYISITYERYNGLPSTALA